MITTEQLGRIEAQVQQALASGDEGSLQIIGYGEVSTVLRVSDGAREYACKRLPRFATREKLERFGALLQEYLGVLARQGVKVVPTELVSIPATDGSGLIGYCVQPILPVDSLGPNALRKASEAEGRALIDRIFQAVGGAVSERLGLDGQLSNWALVEGELLYLDVTTPLLRDEQGRDALDYGVFVASLPWFMRGILERFVAPGIAAKYFDRRAVLLDFVANLFKERLEQWVPFALERANQDIPTAKLSEAEAKKYYRSDAQLWAVLQRLRRWDRAWQRRVRRRPYPFLLPGEIAR